jgi:hypothetical protein
MKIHIALISVFLVWRQEHVQKASMLSLIVDNHANNNDPPDVVDEQSNDAAAPIHNIADNNDQGLMLILLLFVTLPTVGTIMSS